MTAGQDCTVFIADIQSTVASLEEDLDQELEALSLSTDERKTGFRAYSRADAVAAADKALALHSQNFPGTVLKFKVLPGQEFFSKKYKAGPVSPFIISNGRIAQEELDNRKVVPFFNPFPLATFKTSLVRQLEWLGYQRMDLDDRPDSFTMIHLLAGPEKLFVRLVISL